MRLAELLLACASNPDVEVRPPIIDSPVAPTDSGAEWICYQDGDGDGWGIGSAEQSQVPCGDGSTERVGDCDDTSPAAYPGAAEVCDGTDNDCDGAVDSPVPAEAPNWYADADGDGYGDPSTGVAACQAPPGGVADAMDCADARADTHPGAAEVCEDGADNDCAGDGDGRCRLVGEIGPAEVADAAWFGEAEQSLVGRYALALSVAEGGGAISIGAWVSEGRADPTGGVFLFDDPLASGVLSDASLVLLPRDGGDSYFNAEQVAVIRDIDGNSCDEILVAGDIAGVTSGTSWLFDTCSGTELDETDALVTGNGAGASRFGTSPVPVADSDGDEVAELLIAASGNAEEDGTWYREVGRAYLFRNPLATLDALDADVTLRLPGSAEWLTLGEASCSADLDGDGLSEVVLGAPGYGSGELLPSWAPGGAVFVAFAPFESELLLVDEDGAPASNVAMLASDMSMFQYRVGYAVACDADLDGDGTADLAYSDPFVDDGAGRVYVTPVTAGRSELPGTSGWTITGAATQLYLGAGSLLASDLDGDGDTDLTIGGLGEEGNGTSWVFYAPGSSALSTTDAEATITATQYSATGDIDGDGIDDLLVGVPADSTYAHWSGAAYVLLGGSLTPE